ncbi:MAG: hypothetical protein Q7J29_07540 [Stagnimonas sp.]|nr:hypothetical protein [Stagnimonas sp.]
MNTHLWLSSVTLGAALLLLPQGIAQANALPNTPVVAGAAASKNTVKTSKTSKSKKTKPAKRLSKATLSAFQPLDQTQIITPPAGAASAALSPIILSKSGEGLREQPVTVDDSAGSKVINIAPVDQSALVDDGSAFIPDETDAPAGQVAELAADSDALGEESVSVIDRNTDKFKAKPLGTGPLRVRVKDKGVRASVQIPIAGR